LSPEGLCHSSGEVQFVVWQGLLRGCRRMEARMVLSNTDQMKDTFDQLVFTCSWRIGPGPADLVHGYGSTCFTRRLIVCIADRPSTSLL